MIETGTIKKLDFFKVFDENELKVFSERLMLEEFSDHQPVFRENQIGDDSMFIILEGAVKITKKQKTEEKVLANIREGEFFGEMSLLRPAPRSASAITIRPTGLIRLTDGDYNSFKKDYPGIVVKLNDIFLDVLIKRLREADKRLVKDGHGTGAV